MNWIVLCLAQGFFIGRIPVAPGTFGSLLGVAWFAALLATGSVWLLSLGWLLVTLLSVWLCGRAERLLGQTDPGSVVLDEIAAIPLCFGAWVALCAFAHGGVLPSPAILVTKASLWTAGIFVAFRFFDIVKPWPVRQSQALPGGWGITIDDLLAAIYVNGVVLLAWALGVKVP